MLKLSPLFSSGAVLCRRKVIRVFGQTDSPYVTVRLVGPHGQLLAENECPAKDGRFEALLAPQEAALRCVLTAQAGRETVISENIAVGEVYLAGGQSNMELELQNADEGQALIPAHQNDQVRYFNVPKIAVPGDENDSRFENARWLPVAPGTAKDMSAVAYFFAMKLEKRLQVPVGIIDCYWGGTSVTCWMDREALLETKEGKRYWDEYERLYKGKTLEQYLAEEAEVFAAQRAWDEAAAPYRAENPAISGPELEQLIGPFPWKLPDGPGCPYRPAGLYESMTAHVAPLQLSGVIYYQGEEDTWRTQKYDVLLISFIRMLRRVFRDEGLPFLNVQLPMWIAKDAADSFQWPALRLAQQRARDLTRKSSLVCLLDQGEFDNIHPTAKRVVGERLCDEALRVIYHEDAPAAPQALYACPDHGRLTVCLSAPVYVRGEGSLLMEIAGQDGVFAPADAEISDGRLILSSPSVPFPVHARYAWTDYAPVHLFSAEGLPLMPFVL